MKQRRPIVFIVFVLGLLVLRRYLHVKRLEMKRWQAVLLSLLVPLRLEDWHCRLTRTLDLVSLDRRSSKSGRLLRLCRFQCRRGRVANYRLQKAMRDTLLARSALLRPGYTIGDRGHWRDAVAVLFLLWKQRESALRWGGQDPKMLRSLETLSCGRGRAEVGNDGPDIGRMV